MFDDFDKAELLLLIEGELDAARSGELRKRLANDSRALATIERMCADRVALRTAGEPSLPHDFIARLEPALARQMLAEPIATSNGHFITAGELRKQHQRRQWRFRWGRLAAAAVVFVTCSAAIWAAITVAFRPPPSDSNSLAINDVPLVVSSEVDVAAGLSGTIHHGVPTHNSRLAASDSTHSSGAPTHQPATADTRVAAAFALVVHASRQTPQDVEAALTRALQPAEQHTALVRNFSYAEARQIAEQWRMANGGRSNGGHDPAVASADRSIRGASSAEMKSLADRVRSAFPDRPKSPDSRSGTSHDLNSGLVTGSAALAPTLEQQLAFSSRGATHTVAVTVAELRLMLERFNLAENQRTTLALLPEDLQLSSPQTLAAWVQDAAAVRAEYERILALPEHTTVLVPVIVR